MARPPKRMRSAERDTTAITNGGSPLLRRSDVLSSVEDNRLFAPDPVVKTVEGLAPRVVVNRRQVVLGNRVFKAVIHKRPVVAYSQPIYAWRGIPKGVQLPYGLKYESPFFVIKCIRRKVRREVIFALRRNRKGSGAKRRRHDRSGVSC